MNMPGDLLGALGRRTRLGARAVDPQARVYRGRTFEELIPRIRRELGSDAILLRRREGFTGGIFGFFRRPRVEMEAIAAAPSHEAPSVAAPLSPRADGIGQPASPALPPPNGSQPVAPLPPGAPLYAQQAAEQGGSAYVTGYLAALARANTAGLGERALRPQATRRERQPSPGLGWPTPPHRTVAEIAGPAGGMPPRGPAAAAVRAAITQRVPVAPALPRQGAAIVLVGARGAGKTTCCAALLNAHRAGSSLPAAFATVLREPDRGELQLLLHPLLLKPAPLDSPRAVRALRRARGEGLVVIDTPRLSCADRSAIKRLGSMLAELAPERIVVATPATLGRGAAIQPLEAIERGRRGGRRLTQLDPSGLAAMVLE
ncbi:MAG: hypothetical protein ACYDC2_05535 [Solirubrobacteraceae bacterium]